MQVNYTADLKYWRRWLFLGVGFVALVVYLSLANITLPQVPSTLGDKVNHLLAYGALAGWFGQLYTETRQRVLIALLLAILGLVMEFAQGVTDYRYFDWFDACANVLGAVFGTAAIYLGADRILVWFERKCLSN